MSVRVVKVGGSLFDLPSLPQRLNRWLDRNADATNILVAGGGTGADWIRQLDDRFQLGEDACHAICVRLLGATAGVLAALVPTARCVAAYQELPAADGRAPSETIVFDPVQFLEHHEPRIAGRRLSPGWQATTDSIAARLVEVGGYAELVLLKSAAPPGDPEPEHVVLQQLADSGYVDGDFPYHAGGLALRLVDLRDHT